MSNAVSLDKSILATISPFVSFAAVLLSILGLILSLIVIKKQKHDNEISRLISIIAVLLYSGIFIIGLIMWRLF